MTYLKIIQYIYLIFAGFFVYDAYTRYVEGRDFWLSIIIALVAIGMFFFRRHFYNKHQKPKN